MYRKVIDLIIGILFIYFAYLQLNDPDSVYWILIYSVVILLSMLSLFGLLKPLYTKLVSGFFLFLLILKINLLTSWLDAGQPAFIDYEPTDVQVVENIREYMGLIISFIVSTYYLILTLKKPK